MIRELHAPARENRARITSQVLAMAYRVVGEAALVTHATSAPPERERILVKLFLPRDALIEFVVRCWLGLGVEAALPSIRHLAQRWAASRCDTRG